ncbi:MAG: hypothetical protein K1X53_06430 [Candidatus Sumerlaeaceae bacterium]|nr:hypothetical protein [Candidatus Sumerlaeaceae bacterium]
MRKLILAAAVAGMAQLATGGCADEGATNAYWYYPGPEITGHYGCKYLYSCDTGKLYADPMYYRAKATLKKWNRMDKSF